MSEHLIADRKDYSHLSFHDLCEELEQGEQRGIGINEAVENNIYKLKSSGQWSQLPYDFKSIVGYSLSQFKITHKEIHEISQEIKRSIQEIHCKRLEKIAYGGHKINDDIGNYWEKDGETLGQPGNAGSQNIENIYKDIRGFAASLIGYSHLAARLSDFIGKTPVKES